ncbi:MAG: chloride channel protein, partial [Egibacteraceae bacterium]
MTALLRPFARARKRLAARPANEGLMLGLGAGVGLATGLLAALLIEAIGLVQSLSFGSRPGWATILLVPAVGAFGAGVLLTYAFPESSGSGVIQVMRTIAMRGGRFRARVPAGGIAVTGVALGTGASGGREGPIVLIGGSVGSLLGRLFGVGEDALRTLVAAGAAAGIGASFNAPIGGMLFAIELIVGGFRTRSLQVIVVASVVGSVTARQIIGSEIIYQPATFYALSDPRRVGLAIVLAELGLYALLGLAAAGFGLAFLYGEDFAKRMFARLQLWRPFKLALGGLGVGAIALLIPEVLGTGDKLPPINGLREPIQVMLNSEFGVGLSAAGILLLFAIAKLVATCLSIGSGNAIGTFAPALFVGAALGGAVGHVAESLITVADVPPGAFALVGMAALFAAAARAPLTAILIVFELTNDYQLVLPLMLAAGIATFVADRVEPDSVYTHPLRQQG